MCVCVFVSVYVCVEREREGERERFGGFDYLRMIDLSYGTAEWIETKEKNLESKKQTERNWNAGILKNENKQNKLKQKKKRRESIQLNSRIQINEKKNMEANTSSWTRI